MRFPQPPKEELGTLYLEETDAPISGLVESTRYAYFKTIARGGKCILQSCKDLRLSRVVCRKTLRPELTDNTIERQRFLREARVTAMLVHPNTVPVYDLGQDKQGRLFFTMKFVHGYTLREILDYRERYDLTQLVGVLIQIGHALDYAHTHGVVHRDIKPENILVGPYGEVLLLDWGLAKVRRRVPMDNPEESLMAPLSALPLSGSMTDHDQLQGTPSYMSPEQLRRDPLIDGRSDVFGLGTILYEVLSGQAPFQGQTVGEILHGIENVDPVLPSQLQSTYLVPQLLENICLRCLAKDPELRLQSAAELVRDLSEDWTGSLRTHRAL